LQHLFYKRQEKKMLQSVLTQGGTVFLVGSKLFKGRQDRPTEWPAEGKGLHNAAEGEGLHVAVCAAS